MTRYVAGSAAYNGWLGDFGPLHTKTVRPECEEAGDVMDSRPKMFEWNFKHLPGRNDETVECSIACTSSDNELINRELSPRSSNDCDDALSDMLSDKLDAIFRWLKESNGD
ncbi:hypothetical protein PsorP6_005307 [Peronosclerospora sorghi]|uniref:Uncharacterized protein n=1 Tax=Peronosclerospora sorghi TaxID=230839 RepID=A0ACC0W573_9STRA|nr:hypothetical protein PsorP6_005307 [Peronosclerospora sorghi]